MKSQCGRREGRGYLAGVQGLLGAQGRPIDGRMMRWAERALGRMDILGVAFSRFTRWAS